MSALSIYQALEATYRAIDGVRTVQLGEPSGGLELPGIFTAYQEFSRPLRNSPPARNLTAMRHTFATWLLIQWVDNPNAEMQLITLLDAIPDALDLDGRLGNTLDKGIAYCDAGRAGFVVIGGGPNGTRYRVVEYTVTVLEKREGT